MNKKHFSLTLIAAALFLFAGAARPQSGSLDFVTIEEEMNLSRDVRTHSPLYFRLIRNRTINQYFQTLSDSIGQFSDWETLDYKVYIMNRPDILHFSLPGGNIFISRGLIELAETDCELAAVIAHEAVHCSHRHTVQQIGKKYAYALAAQKIVGENPEIVKTILESLFTDDTVLDYDKKNEFSADERAMHYMRQAGYDPDGLIKLLEKMDKLQDSREFLLRHLLRTHPQPTKRLKKLRDPYGALPPPSPAFRSMRIILDRIPE